MTFISNIELSEQEKQAYIDHIIEKNGKKPAHVEVTVDGDYVDLKYYLEDIPFERIRRRTGYLVGTMDKWNDGKTAEERDRVKHSLDSEIDNSFFCAANRFVVYSIFNRYNSFEE